METGHRYYRHRLFDAIILDQIEQPHRGTIDRSAISLPRPERAERYPQFVGEVALCPAPALSQAAQL